MGALSERKEKKSIPSLIRAMEEPLLPKRSAFQEKKKRGQIVQRESKVAE